MKIKPNASPDELSSPFYKENQNICYEFEKYIAQRKGLVKGSYNAWSYKIYGKLEVNRRTWNIMYEKSTFSSGNLLLSAKYQSLFMKAEWVCDNLNYKCKPFSIFRKKISDNIYLLLNSDVKKFQLFDKYIIKSKEPNSILVSKLNQMLNALFISKEVYSISYFDNKLKVELRTEESHFTLLNELLEI